MLFCINFNKILNYFVILNFDFKSWVFYKLEKLFSRTSTSALKVVITAVTTLHAPTPLVDSNVLALADLKVIHFFAK